MLIPAQADLQARRKGLEAGLDGAPLAAVRAIRDDIDAHFTEPPNHRTTGHPARLNHRAPHPR
ncbi:hypothetical protein ACFWBR_05550 [Streptomyces sp. NPDC060006]|uniref:hypothetical protein n=1 Tax=unclassified Streptomyces TaxID=2593676 RepID=UPI0036A91273